MTQTRRRNKLLGRLIRIKTLEKGNLEREVARFLSQLDAAEKGLVEIENYTQAYREEMFEQGSRGMLASQLENYGEFLERLREAHAQQSEALEFAHNSVEKLWRRWRLVKSQLDVMEERKGDLVARSQIEQDIKTQKEADEMVGVRSYGMGLQFK